MKTVINLSSFADGARQHFQAASQLAILASVGMLTRLIVSLAALILKRENLSLSVYKATLLETPLIKRGFMLVDSVGFGNTSQAFIGAGHE